jgi:DNA-binding response OmpR family regulator
VDDEQDIRDASERILTRAGFSVCKASRGEEGLETLKTQDAVSIVLLDLKMPGMDGHEALAQIKQINDETQVIMLTGHGGEESAKASLKVGAFDYLTKPCDIDLLASRINAAYRSHTHKDKPKIEKKARDIMIHIEDYTTITADKTIKHAIEQLMRSFEGFISSSRVMETGHRSILVFDDKRELVGILSILDLIRAVRPAYLSAPKPSMADAMQYSAMFWSGLFTTQTKALAKIKVADVMSETPPEVNENTNLMELANLMFTEGHRRVAVTSKGKIIGVVREQEIFFEMANIII